MCEQLIYKWYLPAAKLLDLAFCADSRHFVYKGSNSSLHTRTKLLKQIFLNALQLIEVLHIECIFSAGLAGNFF